MQKRLLLFLFVLFIGLSSCNAQVQAACTLVPKEQHPVPAGFQDDVTCMMNAIATNPEFVVSCKLYDVPRTGKVYTKEAANKLRHHLFERFGYVDIVALNHAIEYENREGFLYLYLEPVYLRTIQESALSRESAQKILKKLKITKKVSQVAACKRIARWMVQNYDYDIRKVFDYDLKHMMKTKKMVCHGYASIFYALAKECGVDVHFVLTEDHAYNYVMIKGRRYDYDVTNACGDKYKDRRTGQTQTTVIKKYIHAKKLLYPKTPAKDVY